MPYASRNWRAVETTDLIGSKHELVVSGEVETMRTNEKPGLIPARPEGISPVSLLLDLRVEEDGPLGGQVVMWRPVEYRETISPGRYHDVSIRGDAGDHRLTVEQIMS